MRINVIHTSTYAMLLFGCAQVKARVEDLLKGFSVKTQELDGRDAEDDIAAKTYISLGTASPPYPTPQDVPTITTIPEVMIHTCHHHCYAYEISSLCCTHYLSLDILGDR